MKKKNAKKIYLQNVENYFLWISCCEFNVFTVFFITIPLTLRNHFFPTVSIVTEKNVGLSWWLSTATRSTCPLIWNATRDLFFCWCFVFIPSGKPSARSAFRKLFMAAGFVVLFVRIPAVGVPFWCDRFSWKLICILKEGRCLCPALFSWNKC